MTRSNLYQLARIDSLKGELGGVETEFDPLIAREMPALNKLLAKPIAPVGAKVANSSDETRRAAKPIAEHTTEPFFDRN